MNGMPATASRDPGTDRKILMRPDQYAFPGRGERCTRKITSAYAVGLVRPGDEKKRSAGFVSQEDHNAKTFDIRVGDGVCWN